MRDRTYDNRATPREEILLIRIGHHLWRSRKRKEWAESTVMSALEMVWEAKKALRAELREKYRRSREKSNLHLSKGNRFGKIASVADEKE